MHQAAETVGATQGGWKKWEYAEREMPVGLWELYLLKTGQHPELSLVPRVDGSRAAAGAPAVQG